MMQWENHAPNRIKEIVKINFPSITGSNMTLLNLTKKGENLDPERILRKLPHDGSIERENLN